MTKVCGSLLARCYDCHTQYQGSSSAFAIMAGTILPRQWQGANPKATTLNSIPLHAYYAACSMQSQLHLRGSLRCDSACVAIYRKQDGSAGAFALIENQITPLNGTHARDVGIGLGRPITVSLQKGSAAPQRISKPDGLSLYHSCYDPASDRVYAISCDAVVQLSEDGCAVLIAGEPTQQGTQLGTGKAARFSCLFSITSDGRGSLYAVDAGTVLKLQLPTHLLTSASATCHASHETKPRQAPSCMTYHLT